MFAALGYGEKQGGRFRHAMGRLFGEKIVPVKTEVRRGACFFTATVTPGTRIRWDELFVCMGKLSREMVLPEDLSVPDGCGITRFIPSTLTPRVVMNTAVELLAQYAGPRTPVTVIDPHGGLCSLMIPIVRCCADVRIVTDNLSLYQRAGERMMEEYGASIQICPTGDNAIRPGIAVFPFGAGEEPIPAEVVCIMPEGATEGDNVIIVRGIRLEEALRALKPVGLSDFLFASALYEKCAIREIGALTGAELLYRGQVLPPEQAAVLFSAWNRDFT